MLEKFQSHIQKNKLFTKKDKLVLAISGGEDSVVLAHLLKDSGYNFILAHVNFNLRGKDSQADETFCRALAKKLQVKIHVLPSDVNTYRKKHKVGIQEAARSIRYDWFKILLKESQSDYLLTAHHANDNIETLFINLLRGTGIKGLRGIPEKSKKIVRPLLIFEKIEISAYAKQKKISFRLDKSNLEDKYQRNFIRHHIVPKLKELNPQVEQTLLANIHRFKDESGIVTDYLESKSQDLMSQKDSVISIQKKSLIQEKHCKSVFHFMLSPFGFNESQQTSILQNLMNEGLSGKSFYSETHILIIDRIYLFIKPIQKQEIKSTFIHSYEVLKKLKGFKISLPKEMKEVKKNELYLDSEKVIYPLSIRTKKTGDKFKPFGMKGFKLLSDFMKDQKLNSFEKENCRVLVNGNDEIIWVINYRSDERYRVSSNTTSLIKLSCLD